jgi:hypothetical protein
MKSASRWFHYTNALYLCCYPSMPSWRGHGKLHFDLTYKRRVASMFLVLSIKICRTYENWLTAEVTVTDLENDSFIFLAQFIVVVILMSENIRKKTDKKLCVHLLYNLSPRLPYVQRFGNRRHRVTIINVFQWLSHFSLSISWNNSGRIDTAKFLLQVSPTNFLLL